MANVYNVPLIFYWKWFIFAQINGLKISGNDTTNKLLTAIEILLLILLFFVRWYFCFIFFFFLFQWFQWGEYGFWLGFSYNKLKIKNNSSWKSRFTVRATGIETKMTRSLFYTFKHSSQLFWNFNFIQHLISPRSSNRDVCRKDDWIAPFESVRSMMF